MGAFVGRQVELEGLVRGLDDADAGRGQLFLVTGEAGIGKTALAREVARAGAQRGFASIAARCWDGAGAPAYWPFIQIFRALLRDHAAPSRAALDRVPGRVAKVAELAPELVAGSDVAAADTGTTTNASQRFALFDAAVGWLRDIAQQLPLVIVIDDLHAVDPSSLSMLQFVAQELRTTRVLVVGTYRERANGAGAEVLDLLAKVAREATVLHLERLGRAEVQRMVELSKGETAPTIADLVFRTSEGVPLFVEEVLRSLSAPGAAWLSAAPLPAGVRTVIHDRLGRLDDATQRELAVASVVGTRFTLALVGLLSGGSADNVHAIIERAAAADVVERLSPGRYAFSHTMIREALYREMPGGERAKLHAAIVDAMERGSTEGSLAARAHHALRAAPVVGVARAVKIAEEAAHEAMGVHAFEDAAEILRRALAVLDLGVCEEGVRARVNEALRGARARGANAEADADADANADANASAKSLSIVRDGETWVVRFGGTVVRLKDSRGVQMLAQLVESAGQEIHALALGAAPGGEVPAGDSGEVLDREAIDAYRERLVEVEEELREAEAWNDVARMERSRRELELVRAELSRAVGLGGRSRRAGSDAERARVNVQRRLRDAVRRIAEQNADIGRHLERSVRTGTFCAYTPEAAPD